LTNENLQPEQFITSACVIRTNSAYKNGEPEFRQAGLSASDFLDALYRFESMDYPKFHKMDMLSKLGLLAAEILLKDTDHRGKYRGEETGIVLSNTNGSLDVDLKYAKTMHAGASPALFVYTLPNIVIGEIAIRHKIKGENAFFVFKAFHGNFIAEYVSGLFNSGLVKSCICGWVDFLAEEYKALLVLVETTPTGMAIPFTAEQINQLNNENYG
jgi:hypothetical protein